MPDIKPIAMVAEFHMMPKRRLELWSLTVFTPKSYGEQSWIGCDQYDVELSKKYGYIFDQSGSGGGRNVTVSGIYYAWGDVDITEEPTTLVDARDSPPWKGARTLSIRARNRTRRLARLPKQFRGHGRDLLEWLEYNGIQQNAVYCSECGDSMPATGYDYCEHVWWCDKVGWYSTPDDRCGCKDGQECACDKE